MLPTQAPDVWKPANEGHILQALASLGGLPSRQADDAEFDKQVFFVALDGVTRWGLSEAVKAVLQGKLGHGFFPSPPELRLQCDRAMAWHKQQAERIAHRERIERERIPERQVPSEASKARVAEIMARFNRSIGRDAEGTDASFIEQMRAKYGAEALDAIPDNPNRFKVPGFTGLKA